MLVLLFLILLSGRLGCLRFFFFPKDLYPYELPSRTAFTSSHRICMVVFSMSFASRYFLISSLIFIIDSLVFYTVWFNLHVIGVVFFLFVYFSVIDF